MCHHHWSRNRPNYTSPSRPIHLLAARASSQSCNSVRYTLCWPEVRNTVTGFQFYLGDGLWDLLDSHMVERQVRNATADATVEVQRYMADPLIPWTEDQLLFWATRKTVYPHLYRLALQFLCTPASTVPCERIFSKAGEIISKKRNRLGSRTVEQILFLNKITLLLVFPCL